MRARRARSGAGARRALHLLLVLGAFTPGAAASPAPGIEPRPDVYVLLLDSLRRDALQSFEPRHGLGAALAGLARDAVRFEALRAPSSWTRTTVASLVTGLAPRRHRVLRRSDALPTGPATLAAQLRAHGYETRGWFANPNLSAQLGFDRGFDAWVDVDSRAWPKAKTRAATVLARVRDAVAEPGARPRLFFVHLMDAHGPHVAGGAERSALAELLPDLGRVFPALRSPRRAARGARIERYLAEVLSLDRELGHFLAFLRRRGAYQPALLLVVSDHGEELFDHGGEQHGHSLYEELLRVPALLKLPGGARAGERSGIAGELADLAPTLYAPLGVPAPPGLDGIDLLAPGARKGPAVASLWLGERRLSALTQAASDGGWKLVVDHARDRSELYDLARDPHETRDLAAAEPARLRALRRELDRRGAVHEPGWELRVCGCGRPARLGFRLRGEGEPRPVDLEPGDRLETGAGEEVRASFELGPVGGERPRWDSDALRLVAPGATAAVAAEQEGAALPLALGNGRVRPVRGWRELLALAAEARVDPSEYVLCPGPVRWPGPARPCVPHLRIFRAAAAP